MIQLVNTINKIKIPEYLDKRLIFLLVFLLSKEKILNGICKIKNIATKILAGFSCIAFIKFPLVNSINALVVPQKGHSMPEIFSIKQK